MHLSVLLHETVEALAVIAGGSYIDGTLGNGGHASEILRRAGAGGRLMGIDRDREALRRASECLKDLPGEKVLVHGCHGNISRLAEEKGFIEVDGIVLDLGVSSEQLDTPGRGFSFMADGPLDMRMDQSRGESAADLLDRLDKDELAELLKRLGEEPQARRIAGLIVREREREAFLTTERLAETVSRGLGGRRGPRHPATRVFQALRMAVNREMEELEQAMEEGLRLLRPGGRMAVITFESLSDRLVKRCFAAHVGRWAALEQGGERWEGVLPAAGKVTRKAVQADAEEVRTNPRARSAKLRAVRRLEAPGRGRNRK